MLILSYNSRVSTGQKNFYDAKATCDGVNGKLAETKNKVIDDELRKEAFKLLDGKRYWLGITNSASEGSWRYASNNKTVDFTNWWYGRPNPSQPDGSSKNCAIMKGYDTLDRGYWFDYPCYSKHYFICEFTNTPALELQQWVPEQKNG